MDYRDRLKVLRIDHDLEQKDIATLCGVSYKTVSHWETRRGHVPVEYIVKLCEFYHVTADYMLCMTDDPHGK